MSIRIVFDRTTTTKKKDKNRHKIEHTEWNITAGHVPCTHTVSCAHIHTYIWLSSTHLRWLLHFFFFQRFCICNLMQYIFWYSLKAPKCTCQIERTKKKKKKKRITDFTFRYWRSMIQVFMFNILFFVLICLWFFFLFSYQLGKYASNQVIQVGWAFRWAN